MIAIYRVLLADDESLDLDGMLRFIPWEELGLQVAAAVNSGFAACDFLEREKADILVTDVQMPNMTGLELARRAIGMHAGLKVIFVSGHQDFHFVKQALSLHAASYVLKPMDDRELIEALEKLVRELDSERKRRETEQAYRQMIPFVKNGYMQRLLEGSFDPSALPALREQCGPDPELWPAGAAVLETDDGPWKTGLENDPGKQALLNDFSLDIIRFCGTIGIPFCWRIGKFRWALILGRDVSPELLDNLSGYANTRFPFTVTIGVGGAAEGPERLQDSYRQALEALDHKTFHGTGKIIRSNEHHAAGKPNKNRKLIQEVVGFIQDRFKENITLREAADHFSFSPNYLGHLLKKETGKSFSEYVISLRMEKAGRLLKETRLKIYEVADEVGYRYMPYFSRQFRETYGMTPAEFKRRH